MKKRLIISAVNIVNGGPLTILKSFLDAAQNPAFADWSIIALVNPSVQLDFGRVERLNFAAPKKCWLVRIFYEYVVFKRLSQRLSPDVWLSLHDLTPNVVAKKRFVYCHNGAPFYEVSLLDALLDPKFWISNKLYLLFYKINLDQNSAIIVQQQWMKQAFGDFTRVPIHVSHPDYALPERDHETLNTPEDAVFFYPAFPRVFKNHQVLCEAVQYLDADIKSKIQIVFTITGSENLYAKSLKWRYGHMKQIRFVGHLSYNQTQTLLAESSGLLFPSKLETWGLPLTEAKHMGKPIVASNLGYAKETVGEYQDVDYVDPDDAKAWAAAITRCYLDTHRTNGSAITACVPPDSVGVTELLKYLLRI